LAKINFYQIHLEIKNVKEQSCLQSAKEFPPPTFPRQW